jgi:hypothetical protein
LMQHRMPSHHSLRDVPVPLLLLLLCSQHACARITRPRLVGHAAMQCTCKKQLTPNCLGDKRTQRPQCLQGTLTGVHHLQVQSAVTHRMQTGPAMNKCKQHEQQCNASHACMAALNKLQVQAA